MVVTDLGDLMETRSGHDIRVCEMRTLGQYLLFNALGGLPHAQPLGVSVRRLPVEHRENSQSTVVLSYTRKSLAVVRCVHRRGIIKVETPQITARREVACLP